MGTELMNAAIQREEAVFNAVRHLPDPLERDAFLNEACADDPALRARIKGLLAAAGGAEEFFADCSPALRAVVNGQPVSPGDESKVPDESLGTFIGRYKLLQKIGEGGCGVVYMAEQEKPVRRRVALKVIKLGMDTKSVIARFEAERQALAMMDHPNIARVLEAGATETGRPYFVMELVRGIKITEYCDQNNLSTEERLSLFIQVCQAIQHAHQKGIIHRDIKPSNILVTMHDGVPVPKVIDFGIAKATEERLTDKTLFTAYEQVIGTPAYMSPEQAEMSGLDVDTRSDIYSLGVLLYELLTGKTPFDPKQLVASGIDEMRRTLREKDPDRPSVKLNTLHGTELTATALHRSAEPPKLVSLIRGDLDWIVMKAMEKDRRRRYVTANGLAMDALRYLNNEPVSARPPSRMYRFEKLVRRNRVAFAAAGAVSLALILGLSLSTWLFFQERTARKDAEEARANEAELRRQAETRENITQAAILLNEGDYEKANELVGKVVFKRNTVEGAAVVRALGEWHALNGRWRLAESFFSTLLDINGFDGLDMATLDYLEYGCVMVEASDFSGYEDFRHAAAARFSTGSNPFADRILKICLLKPADPALLRSLEPLAAATVSTYERAESEAHRDTFQAAWQCISLALMDYRRGAYRQSIEWAERCLAYPEYNAPRIATARIIQSMATHRLGRSQEARTHFEEGRAAVGEKFEGGLNRGTGIQGFWFDWIFARILLREAGDMLGVSVDPATTGD